MQQIKHIRIRESWEPRDLGRPGTSNNQNLLMVVFLLDDSKPEMLGNGWKSPNIHLKLVLLSSRKGWVFLQPSFFLFQIVLRDCQIRYPDAKFVHFFWWHVMSSSVLSFHSCRNDPIQRFNSTKRMNDAKSTIDGQGLITARTSSSISFFPDDSWGA